jgi:NadR type nicotinamide-nucleotide adenylyltransferase
VVRTGLVIGRFCPPHLGHSHLIARAAEQVDRLVVFVNTRDGEVVPGALRTSWLAQLHPEATVIEVHHDLDTDFGDEALWARWMKLLRSAWPGPGDGPDVVFSSEGYGNELARRFGAEAIGVDPGRLTVPVSATMVREAPHDHLDRLAPPVRAWVEANWLAADPSADAPMP